MPNIQPRPKSPGEIAEQKRLTQYWQARAAAQRPGVRPNRNTMALHPPRFSYRTSEWGKENE